MIGLINTITDGGTSNDVKIGLAPFSKYIYGTLPGGYVIKPFSPEEIMVALELTLMHHKNSSQGSSKLMEAISSYDLSKREGEVLTYVLKRLSTVEIAEKLFLSANTVKFHLKNLFVKTNTKGRKELIDLFS